MIVREASPRGVPSVAVYSPCERYRYSLTRTWDPTGPRLLYIMLNPSKATESANDPTVERCERRARALGYGAFRVTNIFAWRETDPAKLRKARDPVGPHNDAMLTEAAAWADTVLCAWGVHGAHHDRGAAVDHLLTTRNVPVHVLGLTKEGHPRHPLYVSYAARPVPWPRANIETPRDFSRAKTTTLA